MQQTITKTEELRRAIALKLLSFSEEQLSAVLFDVNAISAGIETTNSRCFKLLQKYQNLGTTAENLSAARCKLQELVSSLSKENRLLKHQLFQTKTPSDN